MIKTKSTIIIYIIINSIFVVHKQNCSTVRTVRSGFVFSLWNRSIGDGEGDEVVPLGDGSYEFTFPASSFLEGHADIVVYYKKKGGGVDVNGDGEFNIADVTKLVNMLLKE